MEIRSYVFHHGSARRTAHKMGNNIRRKQIVEVRKSQASFSYLDLTREICEKVDLATSTGGTSD